MGSQHFKSATKLIRCPEEYEPKDAGRSGDMANIDTTTSRSDSTAVPAGRRFEASQLPYHQPANAAVAVLEHFTILPNWKCYPYSSYDKGERFRTSIYGDRNIPTFASEKYPLLCGHQSHIRILKSPHSKFQLPGLNSLTSVFSNEPNRWRSGTIKITCLSNESRCFVSMGNQDTRASFFCGT